MNPDERDAGRLELIIGRVLWLGTAAFAIVTFLLGTFVATRRSVRDAA